MILSSADIKRILTEPVPAPLVRAKDYSVKLRRHIRGKDVTGEKSKEVQQVRGLETPTMKELRAKYCRSNKDLFSRLTRPTDKVFTSRGGFLYLNLKDEKKVRVMLSDVTNGLSIRDWFKTTWLPHYLDDPGGVILMELMDGPAAAEAQQQGRSIAFPVYVPVSSIHAYRAKGAKLDYLVLPISKAYLKELGLDENWTVYRVIDDAADTLYRVEKNGDVVTEISGQRFQNYFAEVPAMLCSSIPDPLGQKPSLSFFDDVIELGEHFFLYGSIKLTSDFQHAYPKRAEIGTPCVMCKGEGLKGAEPCPECKGTGLQITQGVASVKVLRPPETKDDATVKPSEAIAYHAPSKDFHDIATGLLADLENRMTITAWGTQAQIKTTGMSALRDGTPKTATQVIDDMKPQADRLAEVSEAAEQRIKFFTDLLIRVNGYPGYEGCSFSLGRRYLLESPDSVWQKYSEARQKGAPQNVLDSLLWEYYETLYQSDNVRLYEAVKMMRVEPFVHLTVSQVVALVNVMKPEDVAAKVYFSEWLSQLDSGQKLSLDEEALRKNLYEYAAARKVDVSTAAPAA